MQPGQPLQLTDVMPFGLAPEEFLTLGAVIGIVMVLWSLGQIFIERDRFAPRLKMIQERRAELKNEALTGTKRRKKAEDDTKLTFMRHVVARFKLLQQIQVEALQQKLVIAGYRSKDAVIIFAFAKLAVPIAALVLLLILVPLDWSDPFTMGQATNWLMLLGGAYAATRLPELIVANQRGKRQKALRKALPDALDLMMICAEAGLSLAAALDRVSRELSRVSPILAEEFSLTSVELGFLPDRATALKHLAERTALQEVRGFVNVITQTEKYGTPIAQALRTLSKEFRTQRMLRAEQKAARLPAMMTVPMIVFILPTLFVIVLAPAIISVMDSF